MNKMYLVGYIYFIKLVSTVLLYLHNCNEGFKAVFNK